VADVGFSQLSKPQLNSSLVLLAFGVLRPARAARCIQRGGTFTLRDIEDCKAFQEGDAARSVVNCDIAGSFACLLGRKAVGINDGRAAFAFADIAAKRERLLEDHPLVDFFIGEKTAHPTTARY
jgi:hypothetical protein